MKKFIYYAFALAVLLYVICIPVYGAEEEQKPCPPTIEKTVNPTIGQPGDIVRYTIVITNPNDEWVGEHIVQDDFPAHKIRPYMDTIVVTRDGVALTGGHAASDCFLLYYYCLTTGYIDFLFYGLPPLSETVITLYFRVLPDVVEDVKIVNEVTVWFTIWVPGPWDPITGMPGPGHHDRGEYPVDDCYAVVIVENGNGNDNDNGNGNDTGGNGGNGDNGGGGTPWHPPGTTPRPPTNVPLDPPSDPPPNQPPTTPPGPPPLVPPQTMPPFPPTVVDVPVDSTPQPPYEYVPTEPNEDEDDSKPPGTIPPPGTPHNPQTGDDFTLTRLVVSMIGVVLSLGVVFFLVLKLRTK